ncbi:hypothetical protein KFL_011450020 [Klebsormidium nitens]|uniref:Uncharacterized protein n=1 Tax=Klebsormidium nitens TaxID=105231 RepID=A0A1Y1IQ64_KLENI|nr:hypothetical protein KFL_011450020 [Klebsormidium nitens]|eukprot:GAQ92803.1 hypothetical protein KFL_011450020 [Klebsormidium nitens]
MQRSHALSKEPTAGHVLGNLSRKQRLFTFYPVGLGSSRRRVLNCHKSFGSDPGASDNEQPQLAVQNWEPGDAGSPNLPIPLLILFLGFTPATAPALNGPFATLWEVLLSLAILASLVFKFQSLVASAGGRESAYGMQEGPAFLPAPIRRRLYSFALNGPRSLIPLMLRKALLSVLFPCKEILAETWDPFMHALPLVLPLAKVLVVAQQSSRPVSPRRVLKLVLSSPAVLVVIFAVVATAPIRLEQMKSSRVVGEDG